MQAVRASAKQCPTEGLNELQHTELQHTRTRRGGEGDAVRATRRGSTSQQRSSGRSGQRRPRREGAQQGGVQAGAGVARHAAMRAGDEAAAGVEGRGKKLVTVLGGINIEKTRLKTRRDALAQHCLHETRVVSALEYLIDC